MPIRTREPALFSAILFSCASSFASSSAMLVSTWRGYTCERSAAGVSAATTSTVVVASVATLIFDYFITALWGV